jgi:serine/threonine protein kinase/TolB-like protein/Tfp pilus assembly protein PilF
MHPERWQSCTEIFNAAVEQPPNERDAFLERSCDGDEALRHKVELLLKYHDTSGDFIKSPAFQAAPELLVGDPETLIGQHLGCYRVEAVAGVGGMGVVYLACDERLGRKVALKLLPQSMVANEAELRRLEREARTASALNHPNIVTIHEIGEVNSNHYIASEFIEGTTLRERMTKGPIPPNEALDIAAQVASALSVAHRAGIVHRDIKPENIMLRPDGYVKVLDFGIAKLTQQEALGTTPFVGTQRATQQSMFLGTTRYMSPEQAMAQQVDARSDLWSLGVVLYEMLAGRAPFEGETATDVIAAISESDPQPLKQRAPIIPRALQSVAERSLRKDPAERYQTAEEMLSDLRAIKEKTDGIATRSTRGIAVATIAVLLVGLALFYAWRGGRIDLTRAPAAVDKSIAVLPFENLSPDPQNSYLADGVQDELLTDLSRIADLKVIGRTSVMQYKSRAARNLRKIGQQLGVAHLVEGSVERSGNRVRVNAQLIDARTDQRLWGQTYDRDLADVFAIQSEIAKTIAGQLQAKLSPEEKNTIERAPTSDLTAFELYTRAEPQNLSLTVGLSATGKANLLQAIDLLNQAVARDPSFFEAYCRLAEAHDILYFFGYDHTSARRALAEAAIQAASRLRPDAGETHLARAQNLYDGYLDYDGALAEVELARQTLPNAPWIFELAGWIQSRQGRWEESVRNLEHAIELDPRNVRALTQTALSYHHLRRYAEEKSLWDRVLMVVPNDVATKVARAFVEFASRADTRPLHQVIDSILATRPGELSSAAGYWLMCVLAERDTASANTALIALGDNPSYLGVSDNVIVNRAFVEGVIARMTNQDDKARLAFTAARTEQEKVVQAEPNYAAAMCVLGLIDAALGRKEEALREGRRAVELLPVEEDAFQGNVMVKYLAMIAAWVGDKDVACEQLASAIRRPSDLSYGQLKLLPYWDSLRGDPRLKKS